MSDPLTFGKLDDLSVKIGEIMEGQRALSRYTHDHAHDVGNLSGKIDGLGHKIGKQFEELENRINRRIEDISGQLRSELAAQVSTLTSQLGTANAKIAVLEGEKLRREGATSVVTATVKSPVLGWIAGGVAAAWAWIVANGGHL